MDLISSLGGPFLLNNFRAFLTACGIFCVSLFAIQKRLLSSAQSQLRNVRCEDDKQIRAKSLYTNLKLMSSIALPTIFSWQGCGSLLFCFLFVIRAVLNVFRARTDGIIFQIMIKVAKDRLSPVELKKAISIFVCTSLLKSCINNLIEWLRFYLIASYRKTLTKYFNKRLFEKMVFYQSVAVDNRLEHADTVIPKFCGEFAEHFGELPLYFVMPSIDAIVALTAVLSEVGVKPALGMIGISFASFAALRDLVPSFGRIHTLLLNREENFRRLHTDLRNNSERIAALGGGTASLVQVNRSFDMLFHALKDDALAKGHFAFLQNTLGESVSDILGFYISWRLISSQKTKELVAKGRHQTEASMADKKTSVSADLLGNVVVQRSLVTNFHTSLISFFVNFRELSHLSKFTDELAEFERTIDSIARGEFVNNTTGYLPSDNIEDEENGELIQMSSPKTRVDLGDTPRHPARLGWELPTQNDAICKAKWAVCKMSPSLCKVRYTSPDKVQGVIYEFYKDKPEFACRDVSVGAKDAWVQFIDTNIITPTGQLLTQNLNLTIKRDENWAIVGPNGCGKSSLLRVLTNLWMPATGIISLCPSVEFLMLPQVPYFPSGFTLIEQIFYPDLPFLIEIPEWTAESFSDAERVALTIKDKETITVDNAMHKKNYIVNPVLTVRAKLALNLATGKEMLYDVIGGWSSPTAGLFNPHRDFVAAPEKSESLGEIPSSPNLDYTDVYTSGANEGKYSGCNRQFDWYSLSGGQQQKLSLARAFFHAVTIMENNRYPIMCMDESTSQVDIVSEAQIFKNLATKRIPIISISHRKDVVLRHSNVLYLSPDTTWKVIEKPTTEDISGFMAGMTV